VTTDSSIVELSSGSGTSTGLFLPTMSIFPPPPSGLLVSGGGLTVGLPNSPVTQTGLSGCSSSLSLDIYHLERNGARENAGSNPEDVSTGEGMAAMLSGTGNTNILVGYGTQSPEC
jgi:hypothetical protein